MPKLSAATWIPASVCVAAIVAAISVVRAFDATQDTTHADMAALRGRVVANESRIDELRQRQDAADRQAEARFERVLNDLSEIKQKLAKVGERLGIADSRDTLNIRAAARP